MHLFLDDRIKYPKAESGNLCLTLCIVGICMPLNCIWIQNGDWCDIFCVTGYYNCPSWCQRNQSLVLILSSSSDWLTRKETHHCFCPFSSAAWCWYLYHIY